MQDIIYYFYISQIYKNSFLYKLFTRIVILLFVSFSQIYKNSFLCKLFTRIIIFIPRFLYFYFLK